MQIRENIFGKDKHINKAVLLLYIKLTILLYIYVDVYAYIVPFTCTRRGQGFSLVSKIVWCVWPYGDDGHHDGLSLGLALPSKLKLAKSMS